MQTKPNAVAVALALQLGGAPADFMPEPRKVVAARTRKVAADDRRGGAR